MDALRKLGDNLKGAVLSAAGVTDEHANKKSMIEGWLSKRATKSAKNWQSRYFALHNDVLVYYLDINSEFPKGEMKLTSDFYVSDSTLKPFGFQVSDFNETYYLAADTAEEKMFWMHTIARVIRNMSQDVDDLPVHHLTLESQLEAYAAKRPVSIRSVPHNVSPPSSDVQTTKRPNFAPPPPPPPQSRPPPPPPPQVKLGKVSLFRFYCL